jgi:hypothetical protein
MERVACSNDATAALDWARMALAANDAEGQDRIGALLQGLQEHGWAVGRNVRIDIRWAAGNADDIRKYAAELVALAPERTWSAPAGFRR